jgi:integration host factor subunit beta
MAAMNRSELIDDLAAKFGHLTKNDLELSVKAVLEAMTHALAAGHRIEIRGFGSFSVKHRAARKGRNPRSGESVAIPESRVIRFKTGKGLRESVDKPKATSKGQSRRNGVQDANNKIVMTCSAGTDIMA